MKPLSSTPLLSLVLILATVMWGRPVFGESFKLRVDGDRVRVSTLQFHFLTGRALEKLHNGAVVTYLLQLTVRAEHAGKILTRISERFTFSYDLWEEKFAVARQSVPARSASNLSAEAAESWCLENVSIPIAEVPADRSFWVVMEYESEESRDPNKGGPVNLTLGGLIDIFSRRSHDEQEVRGFEEAGPLRLDDLRKKK